MSAQPLPYKSRRTADQNPHIYCRRQSVLTVSDPHKHATVPPNQALKMRTSFLVVALLFVCSCSQQQQRPPNILWIAAEDISAAWGAYGVPEAYTPNLDALAAQGIVYRNAFANAPICAPARSTLITGMYAPSLGTEHLRSDVPRTPGVDTVPEHLKRAG